LLFGDLLANVSAAMMRGEPSMGELLNALTVDAVSHASLAAAAVLFIGVVRSITINLWRQDQTEKWSSESSATATNTSVR
jgi:hypothetical protein